MRLVNAPTFSRANIEMDIKAAEEAHCLVHYLGFVAGQETGVDLARDLLYKMLKLPRSPDTQSTQTTP